MNQRSPGYYLPKEDQERFFCLLEKAQAGLLNDRESEEFLELNLRDQPENSFHLVNSSDAELAKKLFTYTSRDEPGLLIA